MKESYESTEYSHKETTGRRRALKFALLLGAMPIACSETRDVPSPTASVEAGKPNEASPAVLKAFPSAKEGIPLVDEHVKTIKPNQRINGFFLPANYQIDLKKAICLKAGVSEDECKVPARLFYEMEHLMMARLMQGFSKEWANDPLYPDKKRTKRELRDMQPGPQHYSHILRNFQNILCLEELPDYRKTFSSDAGISSAVADAFRMDAALFKKSVSSDYIGRANDISVYGPTEAHFSTRFQEVFESLKMKALVRIPKKYMRRGQMDTTIKKLTLDMFLPAMYRHSIENEAKKASLSLEDINFDEKDFADSTKQGLERRTLYYGTKYTPYIENDRYYRALYQVIAKQFAKVVSSEKPLEFFEPKK